MRAFDGGGCGHEHGDRAIIAVAGAVQRSTRSADIVARFGGDEFIVFLPGANEDTALSVSNRIRQNVYNVMMGVENRMQRLKVSIGVASFPGDGSQMKELMGMADRAMYRDKQFRQGKAQNSVDEARRQAFAEDA